MSEIAKQEALEAAESLLLVNETKVGIPQERLTAQIQDQFFTQQSRWCYSKQLLPVVMWRRNKVQIADALACHMHLARLCGAVMRPKSVVPPRLKTVSQSFVNVMMKRGRFPDGVINSKLIPALLTVVRRAFRSTDDYNGHGCYMRAVIRESLCVGTQLITMQQGSSQWQKSLLEWANSYLRQPVKMQAKFWISMLSCNDEQLHALDLPGIPMDVAIFVCFVRLTRSHYGGYGPMTYELPQRATEHQALFSWWYMMLQGDTIDYQKQILNMYGAASMLRAKGEEGWELTAMAWHKMTAFLFTVQPDYTCMRRTIDLAGLMMMYNMWKTAANLATEHKDRMLQETDILLRELCYVLCAMTETELPPLISDTFVQGIPNALSYNFGASSTGEVSYSAKKRPRE